MDSFRKAYGALKDSTKVGLVKVNNGQFKELDIAIVKATNHGEFPPKERHVRRILAAVSISSPQADVGYFIYALTKRLRKTRSWIVAVKTLIVFHRLLREGDPSFREQLVHISRRGYILPISNFKDDSAWDCSAWVQTYALFLEERVDCFMNLNHDIGGDRAPKSVCGESNGKCKTAMPNTQQQLLEQLPILQELLYRLLCCQPEGAVSFTFLIQYAFAMVVKESFRVYCAINDKIVLLLDTFFEMPKDDAIQALDIYKRAGRQANQLAHFYAFCRTLELTRTFHFPILKQPPPSFLTTMEEYIKEERQTPEEPSEELKNDKTEEQIDHQAPQESFIGDEPPSDVKVDKPPLADLLSFDEESIESNQSEESNALALAIIPSGNDNAPSTENASSEIKQDSWELALFTEPSHTNQPQAVAGPKQSFDRAFLDSLYEDDAARRQLQMQSAGYSTIPPQNPFDQHDPFAMAPIMTAMSQQQQTMFQRQHKMMMMQQQPHQNYQLQQNMMMMMMVPHQKNPYAVAPQFEYSQQHMPVQVIPTNPFADPSPDPQSQSQLH